MDTFIAVDTETTGLSFINDRVIQFGCAIFVKGKCVARRSFYIASTDVPNGGFHVNGITDEQIAAGFDPEYAFTMIALIIHKYPKVLLAYNAPFDLTFLARGFERYGIAYDYGQLKIIDPLVIARHFYPPYYNNKLVSSCSRYRVPYENTHDAADDSEAAGHVFLAQKVWHGLRGEWHGKQSKWYQEWADNFRLYKASRGQSVELNDWPYSEDIACSNAELSMLF
jgi:DNA polymerase III alpha subunit (gram-positive type)